MSNRTLNLIIGTAVVVVTVLFVIGGFAGWFRGPQGLVGPVGNTGPKGDTSVVIVETGGNTEAGIQNSDNTDSSDVEKDAQDKGQKSDVSGSGTGSATVVYQSGDSLDYPALTVPDPARQPVFPDVRSGDRPALVAYESPFEDGDFCDNTPCNVDIPQYYYRVMTAGEVTIPGLDVSCVATDTKGCLVIVINHFGETAMYRDSIIDHGFTIAGRVWDMSSPELVTLAGQALLDHYVGRMTASEDGANCGVITACVSVEWHVIVIGNGEVQDHWAGEYFR